jgi:CMP-N,N'-diacetyllegionaminic acid synthase
MTTLAIIPARGNSRGIKGKNLAMCAGKPLIDWTLEAAMGATLLDKIILSSDDADILARAEFPVIAQPRPAELAQDDTPTEAVINFVLEKEANDSIDTIVLLQPTSPIRHAWHINQAIEYLRDGKYDSVLSVVPSHAFLWNVARKKARPINYMPFRRPCRQKFKQFEENGSIYVFTMRSWNRHHNRIGGWIGLYVMPEEHRIQVDSPFDLEIASFILEGRCKSASTP